MAPLEPVPLQHQWRIFRERLLNTIPDATKDNKPASLEREDRLGKAPSQSHTENYAQGAEY